MSELENELIERASRAVELARSKGAEVAEAVASRSKHLSASVRMGEPEHLEEAGSRGLGLRVMSGKKTGLVHTSDLSDEGIALLVDDALELMRLGEDDPYAGPADPELVGDGSNYLDLDLYDSKIDSIDGEAAFKAALAGEEAARSVDPRIENSDGATFTRVSGARALVLSDGRAFSSLGSFASLVVRPIALDEGDKRRRGFYHTAARHLSDLEAPEAVGREAARRTIANLGAEKIPSGELPIVFDPDVARSMIGLVVGVLLGGSVYRGQSFLADRLGETIADSRLHLVDDPLVIRGHASRLYDGEGLRSRANTIIRDGVLESFLLDSYSARRLGMESTASASRGGSGGLAASSTNVLVRPGEMSLDELLRDTHEGLYVTQMMGFGFNSVTGDFSRGASGFRIDNGELGRPVSEITISLNLNELLNRIDAIANNVDRRSSILTPSFRVASMTVAGS